MNLVVLETLFVIAISSCTKFVQTNPPSTAATGSTVYSNNTSAEAAMTSVYDNMISGDGLLSSGGGSIGYCMGLAADELKNYSSTNIADVQFYTNALVSFSNNASNYYFWAQLYKQIYVCNAVLEGLANSGAISATVKQQLTGEAKFMRAFLYFYATNLYGDVPLATSTDYLENNSLTRTPQSLVYQQIISDLTDAQSKLSPGFVDATGTASIQRVRPNQGAAEAMLARVYLYAKKWDSASIEATMVINNSSQYGLDTLNGVFLANSTEAIFQLQSIDPGYNTFDADDYILKSKPGSSSPVALSTYLYNAFELGDNRLTHWIGTFTSGSTHYYYPLKYKVYDRGTTTIPVTEYTMVLRLAEQYLIRAEAEASLNDLSDATSDLNVIRNRAGLPNLDSTTASAQSSLLSAILHERQVELFTEWGHRWFDLKRTGNLDSLMGNPKNICQAKGGTWSSDWALLPIPRSELQLNPNLTQNPGYN